MTLTTLFIFLFLIFSNKFFEELPVPEEEDYKKMKKYPDHHKYITPLAREQMLNKLSKLGYKQDDHDVILDMMEIILIKEYVESDGTMETMRKHAQNILRGYNKADKGKDKLFFKDIFYYSGEYISKLQEMEKYRDSLKDMLYKSISSKLTLFMTTKYKYLEERRREYFKSIYSVEPMANTIDIQIASLLKLPQQYKLNSFIYENFKNCIDNSEFVINETSPDYYILDAFMQYICKYVTPVNRGKDSLDNYGVHNVFHAFTLNLMYIHHLRTNADDLKETKEDVLRDVKLKFKDYYAIADKKIKGEDPDFIFDLGVKYPKTDTTQFIERIKSESDEDRSAKIQKLQEIFKMDVSPTEEDE